MPEVTRLTRLRFSSIWSALGVRSPEGDLFAQLLARYAEPHRAYHTAQHLEECLAQFDAAAHLFEHAAEGELALWFHDAVYDPHATDNEQRSAGWAGESLLRAGAAQPVIDRVRSLILITAHDVAPASMDEQLVADIDLSILGAGPARFAEYETQVRREYAWVPEDVFRRERSRVLRQFLDRPSIYRTAFFRDRFEAKARQNISLPARQ